MKIEEDLYGEYRRAQVQWARMLQVQMKHFRMQVKRRRAPTQMKQVDQRKRTMNIIPSLIDVLE